MSEEQDIFYHSESSGFELNADFSVTSEFTSVRRVSETDVHVLYQGLRHGRIWVLKGLQPLYKDNDECRQMLVKEFDIMMSLQHGSVVAAHSIETVGDLGMCIVMEYVNGMTLSEWLKERHTLSRRLQVTYELCDAFAFINKCGIVHRDIKPENIMISRIGERVKIIDFGHADTDNHSLFKYPAGTEGFISPEQMSSSEPDVRNDIYSFGKVLDFLLPEKRFNNTRSRCVTDIKERFSSFEKIKKYLLRDSRKLSVYLILMMSMVFAGIIVILAFSGTDEKRPLENMPESIENTEATAQDASGDSVSQYRAVEIAEKTNKISDDHGGREREMPDIKGVLTAINDLWQNTAVFYLDTISDFENIYPDWTTYQMEIIRDKFLDSLPESVAFEERMDLKNKIDQQIDLNYKKWHKRRMQMRKDANMIY